MYTGCRQLQIRDIRDDTQEISFPALVMYPTEVPSIPTSFGPYSINLSMDAPVASGRFPLVIVSHGIGGSHLLYRTICTHLAQHGYIVAMLEHYGNNRNNNSLENTYENLVNRPRHVRMTIDEVSTHSVFKASVKADNVAVIGHSIGAYTALAVAGGEPWSKDRRKVEVVADTRVKALVLLAPATPWYLMHGSLSAVNIPILMLTGEHDQYTPPWHADLVSDGVADRALVTRREIKNAGHFSFLSPFPAHINSPTFHPSTDPEGFDRGAFHQTLPGEVLAYLDRHLKMR